MFCNPRSLLSPDSLDVVSLIQFARLCPGNWSNLAKKRHLANEHLFRELGLHANDLKSQLREVVGLARELDGQSNIQIASLKATIDNSSKITQGTASIAYAISRGIGVIQVCEDTSNSRRRREKPPSRMRPDLRQKKEQLIVEYARITKRQMILLTMPSENPVEVLDKLDGSQDKELFYSKDLSLTKTGFERLGKMCLQNKEVLVSEQLSSRFLKHQLIEDENAELNLHLVEREPISTTPCLADQAPQGFTKIQSDASGSLPLIELLLKDGGMHYLNHAPIWAEDSLLEKLDTHGHKSHGSALNQRPVIAGSSVLELYGLRVAGDIDYFTLVRSHEKIPNWDLRNPKLFSKKDIWVINSEENHFDLRGYRFQTLFCYLKFQDRRKLTGKGRRDFFLASVCWGRTNSSLPLGSIGPRVLRQVLYAAVFYFEQSLIKLGPLLPRQLRHAIRKILSN